MTKHPSPGCKEWEYVAAAIRFLDAFSSDEKGRDYPVILKDKVIPLGRFLDEWKLARVDNMPELSCDGKTNIISK